MKKILMAMFLGLFMMGTMPVVAEEAAGAAPVHEASVML
jgi:hypothetical protein